MKQDIIILIFERPLGSKDLYDFINENGFLNESLARDLFQQIMKAILACHQRGVIHRDIKDENLLVTISKKSKPKVQLIDFGSGAHIQNGFYNDFASTRTYAPPEVIKYSPYNGNEAKVWSLGILLYSMVCGDIPFHSNAKICKAILRFKRKLSLECQNLIEHCLRIEPAEQILLEDILCHPWMKKDDEMLNCSPTTPPLATLNLSICY